MRIPPPDVAHARFDATPGGRTPHLRERHKGKMEPIHLAILLQGSGKVAASTVPTWVLLVSALATPIVSVVIAYITLRAGTQRDANRLEAERTLKVAELDYNRQ